MSFFISAELDSGLKELKRLHGTPEAESIRRAIAVYLVEKGVKPEVSKIRDRKRTRP